MIGLLPAAGNAERISGLPKFLLPIADSYLIAHHYRRMRSAGCGMIFIGGNKETTPMIVPFTEDHCLVYPARDHATMSETILSLQDEYFFDAITKVPCLFGMPDTYIEDVQVYQKLANALNDGAQLAVALFYTRPEQRSKLGMVNLFYHHISTVIDKPETTELTWAWGALAWQPVFWQYIRPEDPHVGYAIPRAIEAGLDVRAVEMDGNYWDCGTPDEYFEMIRSVTGEKVQRDPV